MLVDSPVVRVVVVGSINADMTLCVTRLPALGETVLGRLQGTTLGGKGANQAVTSARQGATTALVGKVGGDAPGRALTDLLAAEGLDLSDLSVAADAPTGQALITVDDSGANTIVVAQGANAALTPDDVEHARTAIRAASVVLCQLETPIDSVRRALSIAREAGVTTVLNPAPATSLPDALLALVDVLVPNEAEAASLAGTTDMPAALEALRSATNGVVVITLGAAGALVAIADRRWNVPSLPVTAIDTTAAGDAFCGTLAAGLARRLDLGAALSRAAAAGAHAATVAGALASLPTPADVDAMLSRA
jgi:ribokinase